ncbi:hypothetical protein BO94DRAFT_623200 [Aspergillus sclerotioniger CBS 115572]|uniref:Uncharacterized protein n=1 Tax=Aspergillus sclerotioniger CBS 115572 TaxID=1450535 RepID=A0A317X0B6_9EURO|nr:hypothetical protein BO94DRAFT_623200 [Aspergillus sclerotioniger CBS 115572]PWY90418.1 hypothetical protein BO94DRAFT_623200 [Aspergillus sclerotioniger CBS 115572]
MATHYNLIDYDSDAEKEKHPLIPLSNLISAALFIAHLLEKANIPYGLMGGLAVSLLGSNRTTRDVDIAFQAPGKMRDLWGLVEREARLIIPNTKLLSNIMKVFVHTGPGYDDCGYAVQVEVDLIESGYQGSPRDIFANRRLLTVNTRTGVKTIYGIELFYLLRGKMAAFASRASPHDLHDVQHLLSTYGEEVRVLWRGWIRMLWGRFWMWWRRGVWGGGGSFLGGHLDYGSLCWVGMDGMGLALG